MCSIMGIEGKGVSLDQLRVFFDRTLSRGPDMSRVVETPTGYLCFHRLAIMDLTAEGMQPFELDGDMVACNGELYGFRPLHLGQQHGGAGALRRPGICKVCDEHRSPAQDEHLSHGQIPFAPGL